jgi:hypothetical protein
MSDISKLLDKIDMTKTPERPLFDIMERWLAGEPVWTYAKIIETCPQFENGHRRIMRHVTMAMETGGVPSREEMMAELGEHITNFRVRDVWIRRYGFAIPCAELLDELATNKLVVEIGAGTGYMTALMRQRGIDVRGSDLGARDDQSFYGLDTGKHDATMATGMDAKRMVRCYPDAAIFCCWPSLKETWFRQALKAMRVGQKLIVVREECCAEPSAWRYLDDCFETLADITLPNFYGINDYAQVCVKSRQRR